MGAIGKGVAWGAAGLLLMAGCTHGVTPSSPTDTTAASPPNPSVSELPTTPVPPPSSGNIDETEAPGTPAAPTSVGVRKTAAVTDGLKVNLASIKGVQAKATNPGDVAGPAVQLEISVTNGTKGPVDVSNVVVTVTDAAGNASSEITGPPSRPFSGTVSVGRNVRGIYLFRIEPKLRSNIRVVVSVGPGYPDAVFTGDV